MPKLTASSEDIKGLPQMKEGMLTVRLDGFKPAFSKDRGSVNLNPTMKVINHSEYNDRQVFENLNTKAKFIWKDFCHGFGVPLLAVGDDFEFPGEFDGPEDQPDKWEYRGPLLGQQAQLYIVQTDYQGKPQTKVKYYVCNLPGCVEKHSSNLAK